MFAVSNEKCLGRILFINLVILYICRLRKMSQSFRLLELCTGTIELIWDR